MTPKTTRDDLVYERARLLVFDPMAQALAVHAVPALWLWADWDWRACPRGPTAYRVLRDWFLDHDADLPKRWIDLVLNHATFKGTYRQSPRYGLPYLPSTDNAAAEFGCYARLGKPCPLLEAIEALHAHGVASRTLREVEAAESVKRVRIARRGWARRALALRAALRNPPVEPPPRMWP